jgi:hypothetical protein
VSSRGVEGGGDGGGEEAELTFVLVMRSRCSFFRRPLDEEDEGKESAAGLEEDIDEEGEGGNRNGKMDLENKNERKERRN